jgi:uncharacterized protein Yka (UPF0111/DUF47 family)
MLRARRGVRNLRSDEDVLEQTNIEMLEIDKLVSRLDNAARRLERVADRIEGRRPRGNGPGRT